MDKNVAWDHNYSRNNITTAIKNDESNIFGIQDPNQSIQKTILQPHKKCRFILIKNSNIIMLSSISLSLTNSNFKKEIDLAAKKILELSTNVKNMRKKNKILQQKLRRYKKNYFNERNI